MLKGVEKARALQEFRSLRLALTGESLKGVEKAKAIRRFRELRLLLGGQNATQPAANNPVYQRVIDGEVITRELLVELDQEASKEATPVQNPQLVQAATIAVQFMQGKVQKAVQEAV